MSGSDAALAEKERDIEAVYLRETDPSFNSSTYRTVVVAESASPIPACEAVPPIPVPHISLAVQTRLAKDHETFHAGQNFFEERCFLCQEAAEREREPLVEPSSCDEESYRDELQHARVGEGVSILLPGRKYSFYLGRAPDVETKCMIYDSAVLLMQLSECRLKIPSGYPTRLREKFEAISQMVRGRLVQGGFLVDNDEDGGKQESVQGAEIKPLTKPAVHSPFRENAARVRAEWEEKMGLVGVGRK